MSHVSIIGGGNMGQAIATIVTKGGNTGGQTGSSPVEPLDHARMPGSPVGPVVVERHRAEGSGRSPERIMDRHRSSTTASQHYGSCQVK